MMNGTNGISNENNTTNKYLTFVLATEEYAVDILRVQEIKGWSKVTPIPNTPDYIRGVINLRRYYCANY
ncbi:MAG: chemotaxis protein CheW [Thiotrichaceae bacterium]